MAEAESEGEAAPAATTVAESEVEAAPAATPTEAPPTEAPPSPGSSIKSGSTASDDNRFTSLSKSIMKNIETMNFVTKEVEKINDRFLFRASTITPAEESTLMNKVTQLHKDTSMKARDTSRMVKNLRVEVKTPSDGSKGKKKSEKSEEELAEESRAVEEREALCKNVCKCFTDELLLYQSAIQDFKNEMKERLTKKVQSIRPKSSAEDFVDMSLRSESSRYALFREIMATDEQDLSEEDAKALKDEIAEKYVVIAELSSGASELNKIFLNLASSAAISEEEEDVGSGGGGGGAKLSDSDSEERVNRSGIRSKRERRSSADKLVDELLGDPSAMRGPSQRKKDPMDNSGSSNMGMGSQRGMRNNRLLNFMRRHRGASTTSARKLRLDNSDIPPRKRRGRGGRWMALFLLATVAVAAMVGIVMIH